MTSRFAALLAVITLGATSLVVSPAHAAKKDDKKAAEKKAEEDKKAEEEKKAEEDKKAEEEKKAADDKKADDDKAAEPDADAKGDTAKAGVVKSEEAAAGADAATSPVELEHQTYRFVGLRYRGIIVPKFMINLFGQGGKTVYVNGFGPEFAVRRDGFEYDFSMWYAAYSMDPTPFKASSDPPEAWEIVASHIKVLFLTADFLWSHDVQPEFAINYGLGAGIGLVWGDLFRTQAYGPPGSDTNTGAGFQQCNGPGNPGNIGPSGGPYCGSDNGHYVGYKEPSWANGGSKPILFPWLVLQTGLRYKPHKNFVGRLDLGFGTSGPFFGIGADYGL